MWMTCECGLDWTTGWHLRSATLRPASKEGSYHGPHPMAARPLLPRSRTAMSALIGLLIATTLVIGSGCAKQDWIDRTLVTVDVTGTWYGGVRGGWAISDLLFELEQQGATVKGSVQWTPGTRGDIEGTLARRCVSVQKRERQCGR